MYNNQALYSSLKELHVIADKELDEAFSFSQTQKRLLGDILLERNLITEKDLAELLSDIIAIPLINLSEVAISKEILFSIPEVVAKQNRIIAFKKDQNGLHVAMENPLNKALIEFLQSKLGIRLVVYLATRGDIENALSLYLKDIGKAFEDVIKESVMQALSKNQTEIEPPIIKIVETIVAYAYKNNASDVHIEPHEQKSLIRFRIDGVLHDIIQLSSEIHPQLVTRIKVLAKLRTDEHQIPQDGKITFVIDNQPLDIRVSTVPIERGERIVMRLLSQRSRQISLETLGISNNDLIKVANAYKKPYGMLLSTGPTGSGKTTTMYAILKQLNTKDTNIMTIEDPIEYDIEGVNQIQVNTKTNLTFATGLRSILRQDPNVILVGEIRDEETADIAINAAMTGHLVLSTLHTNDAATAIPRLFDMGIEPFLIASTINIIIAQRLIRKIHNVCRVSEEVSLESLTRFIHPTTIEKFFGNGKTVRLYKGKGCEICHNSGYEGRIGIYEILELNDEIKQAIVEKNNATVIRNLSIKAGMQTMLYNGLEKVKSGETTLEELLRVTKA